MAYNSEKLAMCIMTRATHKMRVVNSGSPWSVTKLVLSNIIPTWKNSLKIKLILLTWDYIGTGKYYTKIISNSLGPSNYF